MEKTDTELELELLQKYIFIPLDIFGKIQHNKDISDKLNAWLVFLSSDDPDTIVRLKAQLEEEQKKHKEQMEELEYKYQEAIKQLAQSQPQ